MSIAFNQRIPVIDGNVKRVTSRFWEMNFLKANDIKILTKKLLAEIDSKRPGCFNQALMDLGREICKPRIPECLKCPISSQCKAFMNNTIATFPYKSKKKVIPLNFIFI